MRRARLIAIVVAAAVLGADTAVAASGAWPAARVGTASADRITGGTGADHLRGLGGPDRIDGRGGDDLLTGDTGGDRIRGGRGDDTITGAAGGDYLIGDAGDDVVLGGFGSDTLDGGPGDDVLDGANDRDLIRGGAGDDVLHGGSGPDLLDAGPGDDVLFADSGSDILRGGDGRDTLFRDITSAAQVSCGGGEDTLYLVRPTDLPSDFEVPTDAYVADCEHILATDAVPDPNQGLKYLAKDTGGTQAGTARDDLLLGGPGADTLRGGTGNDILWGLRQAGLTSTLPDVLDAGPGDDTIYGGPGPQTIDGGSGDDFINGGLGRNTIRGGDGRDTIRLRGNGTATVDGGRGNDVIYVGGAAAARVRCGAGTDTVFANRGDAVARDCERVQATADSAPSRVRAAPVIRAATARDPEPTYANLVRTTPGLRHFWRVGRAGPPGSDDALADRTTDEVTGQRAFAYRVGREPGATDDGDMAWSAPGVDMRPQPTDAVALGPMSTIEAWVRTGTMADPDGTAGSFGGIYSAESAAGDPLRSVSLGAGAGGVLQASGFSTRGVLRLRSPAGALSPDRWHHVALTRDGTTARLYVDGDAVAEGTDIDTSDATLPAVVSYSGGHLPFLTAEDEFAVYDRALPAATLREHARVGDDGAAPVTTLDRPLEGTVASPVRRTLTTRRGGSTFRCLFDGFLASACPASLDATILAGAHTLQIRATDRFGRVEAAPVTYRFTVDDTIPDTFTAALIRATGDVASAITFGSDDPAATFECAVRRSADAVAFTPEVVEWRPCRPGFAPPTTGVGTVLVRAVDPAGNADPTPSSLRWLRPPADGDVPALGAAQADVAIAIEQFQDDRAGYSCTLDGIGPTVCGDRFRLPLLRQGPHTLQVRENGHDLVPAITTAPLTFTVGSPRGLTLTAVQFATVVESSSRLAVRVPRVRVVVDRPAQLTLAIVGPGGTSAASFTVPGRDGPNAVKIPATALRRLGLGRYTLVVRATAAGPASASAELPFAVIPRVR